MRTIILKSLCLAASFLALVTASHAVTKDNFLVRDTNDIIALCTAPGTDPLYTAAVHFCHGYLVGAYHYQDALYSGPGRTPLVCPPNPKPSRDQAIAGYIAWARQHPEYGKALTVNTMMKYAVERWPCK